VAEGRKQVLELIRSDRPASPRSRLDGRKNIEVLEIQTDINYTGTREMDKDSA
jgi:hypothetical protein